MLVAGLDQDGGNRSCNSGQDTEFFEIDTVRFTDDLKDEDMNEM